MVSLNRSGRRISAIDLKNEMKIWIENEKWIEKMKWKLSQKDRHLIFYKKYVIIIMEENNNKADRVGYTSSEIIFFSTGRRRVIY